MPKTYVKDPQVSFIEGSTDILSVIRSYFPEYEDGRLVLCPNHTDEKASLSISLNGKAKCHGCGLVARDIVDFVAKMNDLDYEEVKTMMYEEIVNGIPESKVQACVKALGEHKKLRTAARKYLRKTRNLSSSVIEEFKLGYEASSERITIPIYDKFKTCVNMRRIAWTMAYSPKALNLKGHGEVRLFPENKIVFERRLLLVEGEWDCLVGRSMGLPTCTWTGGAASWNEKYEHFFRDKAVWVLYDNDKAGDTGATQAMNKLEAAQSVHMVANFFERGTDLTDISKANPSWLSALKKTIESFKFPSNHKPKKFCPTCGAEVKR